MEQGAESRPADAAAKVRLAADLLTGKSGRIDTAQSAVLLAEAAAQGSGEADALLASLAAAGIGQPPDWNRALDHLEHAAESGWPRAQGQLRLLAGDPASLEWKALRRRIDLQAWLAPPAKTVLAETPRIRAMANFISPGTCDWLIGRARDKLMPARVYDAGSGRPVVEHSRTNTETDFDIVECDLVILLVRARIAAATGLPPAVMELTKVLHYEPGERFEPHYDFIDPQVPAYTQELAERGQRLVTFLVYLSDDYSGGETDFPRIGLRHKGRKGDALYFANVDAAGQPERQSLHAGLAPTRGEKWLLSQWIRDRSPPPR